jgi:hypothetical protein
MTYSSILKKEALRFPETSLDFCHTTRYHITKDIYIHSHRRENTESHFHVASDVFTQADLNGGRLPAEHGPIYIATEYVVAGTLPAPKW